MKMFIIVKYRSQEITENHDRVLYSIYFCSILFKINLLFVVCAMNQSS